jgi:serine/threonine-protein kinase RsbW
MSDAGNGVAGSSPAAGSGEFSPAAGSGGFSPAAGSGEPVELVSEMFDTTMITSLRHEVTARAAAAGLVGSALEDFVLAVNELVTNAVRHGGGEGWLSLWLDRDRLVCEVTDKGGGIAAGSSNGRQRPSLETAGGWGMWLARELSESMKVSTGPAGTTVQISAVVPAS